MAGNKLALFSARRCTYSEGSLNMVDCYQFAYSLGLNRESKRTPKCERVEEDRVGSKRISPAASLQNETPPLDCFGPVEEPEEPLEIDRPIQCPPSEPSIMEDGILWRARILASLSRRNDILNLEREPVVRGGSFPTRRKQKRSMEDNPNLFVAHSAPESQVRNLLSE